MNERIRGLLNEATSGLEPDLSEQRTVTLNEMEKFAQLIVEECGLIINNDGRFLTYTALEKKIKKHFGIKE